MPVSTAADEQHVRTHGRVEAGPFRISHKSYSSEFVQGWHEHDVAAVDFVLAGGGEGIYAGEPIGSQAGAIEYFAAGIRHRFRAGPRGIRTLHVVIPRDVADDWGLHARVLVRSLDGTRLRFLALALLRELAAGPSSDALLLESLALRMLGEVGAVCAAPADDQGEWIREVCEFLLEEPEHAGSLRAVADRVGRHPSHVARHFHRRVGVSVGEFGRRVRLARAARALASDRDGTIAGVAIDSGFADQAHFSRCFKAAHGCTPAEYRRALGLALSRDS